MIFEQEVRVLNDMVKNVVLWAVIASVLWMVFQGVGGSSSQMSYSDFLTKVEAGQIREVSVNGSEVSGVDTSGKTFATHNPEDLNGPMIETLLKNKVNVVGKSDKGSRQLMSLLFNLLPVVLIIGFWFFMMRQMQGGGKGGAMSFGKSRARMMGEDQIKTTFADVAGVEEAKDEVQELVEFLRDPAKFQKLGGKIPRGVLMVGSPGTGKTLLAKAIAGEAKVPFFTISGSDFVEMFVGVGASRVRDMFEQAKKHAPCIIFIDEIDAVGRHRGAGLGGGHDEREQTLNQLLVEMDGFEGNEGIIVIAATNRPDVLDPALLRPGRFDRQVTVPLPDVRGREQILKVHMRKVPTGSDVKPALIARGTPGFSGADLANLVNEAALFAARGNKREVEMQDFERAKDKILMGSERKSMVMSEQEKKLTAYHEAGHAIVGRFVPDHDPVYKVTIIPRGRALGVTMYLPEQDRYSHSKQYLDSRISSLFGGRIAEILIFGADMVTTGAQSDIERATDIARSMVTRWGLSDRLGPLAYGEPDDEVFLGRQMTRHQNISDDTSNAIDKEIRLVIDRNYQRAEEILKTHMDKLHTMSEALMKYETIDAEQIEDIMAGRPAREPKDWNNDDHSDVPPLPELKLPDSTDNEQNNQLDKPAGSH